MPSPADKLMPAFLLLWLVLGLPIPNPAAAQPPSDAGATTESSCNFGMAKNQAKGSCEVPMLAGCVVARFPGADRPWSNVSKGGNTSCRFDENATDWKTKITGACGPCKTPQCTARFGVMFDCSARMPAPITQQRAPTPKP
ncbi:MAG: hypothetical protein ACKOCD_04605 [Nitrospiraceae bacterium]